MEEVCAAQAEDSGHPRSGSFASSHSGSSGVVVAAAGVTASSEAAESAATQSVASVAAPVVLPTPESVELPETAARAAPVTAAAAPPLQAAPPAAANQVGGLGANVPAFSCVPPCGPSTAVVTVNGQKEEDITLIGRVRRWHDKGKWGFVFSELHCSDLYFDSAVIAEGDIMREGAFVLFTAFTEEDGTLCVQSAKIAEVGEVRRQQELLSSIYKHYSMRGIKAAELPRSVNTYDIHPGAVGSEHTPGGRSSTLSPQEARRGGPPPPPQMPPQHVAHTSTGFSAQAQAYPGYPGYAVPNMFQQQWPGGQAILGTTASVATHMDSAPVSNQQLPGANLLLQPPLAFDKLDTKEIVNVLRGGSRPRRRQTLPCNWTGSASRIASDFCQIVRQAMQAALDNGEVHHQHHSQQNQNWGDSQWGLWSSGGDGQLNNGAHGDAYAGAVVNAMGGPVMMNMHGGDSSLHQQQQPC